MTKLKDSSELFKKIVQDYEKRLVDASYQFQASVMAAQHEMDRMVLEFNKIVASGDSNTDGSSD